MGLCSFETLVGLHMASAQELKVGKNDEDDVKAYVANFAAAWDRHDADALFGQRGSQIDRINAFGGWINDPAADERVMRRLFAGPFSQSKHKIAAERIRFLTPTVAIAIIHMVRIHVGPDAGPASDLGNRALHVLVKAREGWQLAAFANVPIITPAEAVRKAEGQDVIYADPIS
jgi:uncharacterized protein (TIGR02246 family)